MEWYSFPSSPPPFFALLHCTPPPKKKTFYVGIFFSPMLSSFPSSVLFWTGERFPSFWELLFQIEKSIKYVPSVQRNDSRGPVSINYPSLAFILAVHVLSHQVPPLSPLISHSRHRCCFTVGCWFKVICETILLDQLLLMYL